MTETNQPLIPSRAPLDRALSVEARLREARARRREILTESTGCGEERPLDQKRPLSPMRTSAFRAEPSVPHDDDLTIPPAPLIAERPLPPEAEETERAGLPPLVRALVVVAVGFNLYVGGVLAGIAPAPDFSLLGLAAYADVPLLETFWKGR